ncbi:hypothetical protein Ddc_13704 [Ditylenchus destructor]|nr:hypothetical protein Ddc_13704 [Ditylenchus destructor]
MDQKSHKPTLGAAAHSQKTEAGLWIACNPWEMDWTCSYCRFSQGGGPDHYIGPSNCYSCKRPRVLEPKEEKQARKLKNGGEKRYANVAISEFEKDSDGDIQFLRNWCNMPIQTVTIGGEVKFVLMAFNGNTEDERCVKQRLTGERWHKIFSYPEKRPLNQISKDILSEKFGTQIEFASEEC